MLVTRETDYAVRTVLYLAKAPVQQASATDIAQTMQIPKSFLAKILQRLVRSRILTSSRGARGGFRLDQPTTEISLLSIMEAIQGPACINVCAVDARRCGLSNACMVHPVWVKMRQEVETTLRDQTIDKLITNNTAET
jgi:Rrf2 family protein